jgi:Na+/proline symporter
MRMNLIDILVLAAYLVSMLVLGLYQARKIKNAGDFFAGGRKFNKFLMMMHALGTGTHADDPVAVVGASYKMGLAGIWYTFIYLFVTPFYWIIAPLFRRSRFLTTADFFEARFGSKLGTLYAIWGILIFSVNIGTLLKGTEMVVTAVTGGAISPVWSIVGMSVVFILYGTAGGLVATVVTESVQGLLIVVMSLLLIPFGLAKLGGFAGLHAVVTDPNMFALTGNVELGFWWIIAGSINMLIGIVAQPHIMEVCSAGKTEYEGRVGFTYGNMVKRLCSIGWALTGVVMIGMVAKQYVGPMEREAAFGTAMRALLPVGLTGLMFAAILAAQMSTLSAFMVAASALLSRNIYKKHIRPDAEDKDLLRVARYAGLAIVGIGVLFAFLVAGVADALMWFWTLSAFTGLFMWFGVLWRKTNATGAWASFVVMLGIWLVVGEPGQAVSQHMAAKAYARTATPAQVTSLAADAKPISRLLFDVARRNGDKIERKDRILLIAREHPNLLGAALRPATASDHAAMSVANPGGVVIDGVVPGGNAAQSGFKKGDMIVHCARMPYAGVYADKSLLHFRLAAFLPAGILALIIGSLLGAPHPKDKLDRFYALLKTPVGKEDELAEQGIDVIYAGASKGHPWELKHGRAVNVIGFLVALAFAFAFVGLLWLIGRIGA